MDEVCVSGWFVCVCVVWSVGAMGVCLCMWYMCEMCVCLFLKVSV